MKVLTKESLQGMKFYTNSTISLVPQLSEESKKISFIWKRRHYIKSLSQAQVISTNYQYLCSPLDENCYIDVQIQFQNKIKQTRTIGPIQLQKKLTLIALPNVFQTRIILNKNVPYQAQISFVPHQTNIFEIEIQGQKMVFENQFICYQRWKHLETSPTDPNVLLLNTKLIKKQFLNFIKKLFIPLHFGDSLKIMFKDRFSKDVFLLRVIEWSPSYDVMKQKQKNEIVIPLDQSKSYHEDPFFDKNKSEIRDDVSIDIKIMQDIYDVLYTPHGNQHNASRRQYNTQNFYRNQFIQTSQNQNSKKTIQTIKIDKRKGSFSSNKEDNLLIEQSFGYASTKKDITGQINSNLYNTSRPDITYSKNYNNNNKQRTNEKNYELIRFLLNDPQKIQNLLNINQQLIDENQRLKKQNAILKNQKQKFYNNINQEQSIKKYNNMLYPSNSLHHNHKQHRQSERRKNSFNSTNWNMPTTPSSADTYQITQLKNMIQEMSKRIIRLQEKQKPDLNQINDISLSKKNSCKGQFKIVAQAPSSKNQLSQFRKNQKASYQINQINFGNTNNNHFIHYQTYNRKAPISSFSSPNNQGNQQFGYVIKSPNNNLYKTHTGKTNDKFIYDKIPNKKPSFLEAKSNYPTTFQRNNSKSPIKR